MKILMIPDTQVKPGVPTDHLEALGNYIVEKRPNVIVMIGDWFDMKSLSSYDRGKKASEGQRVQLDIEAGKKAMVRMLTPLWRLQERQRQNKKKVYNPRMVFCIGNHEERIMRHVEANPELEGLLSYDNLGLKEMGWEVYDFLEVVQIGGIAFSHYFYNPMSGRPYGGTIHTKLKNIKHSFAMGHQQGLDIATVTNNVGQKMWGLVAGSFYMHDEGYIGPQGNDHFRGIVMMHNVDNGDYNPCIISLNYLLNKYL